MNFFLTLLFITGLGLSFSACHKTDNSQDFKDIQKEEEFNPREVFERDTYSDDGKLKK